ncbi:YcaO-like family protein [Actinomadura rupiterrae]|uniref:YcaO-like family protein n=1 Tax=Actinomadura rupiterrae TaxID=559627 RepID=UPI0020A37FED|nr:YcaO-like family protein [Actinomadura rupiterrae]MCP2342052.1 ribosomal protein S12 methylthiotransferase accessory factor [Actinomadura rupiterrae]
MEKVFFTGTHRVRDPGDTLAAITPLLPRFGITRLADVTGLDAIGIPVVMAVRPLAATLAVAQGKGATLDAARVSAAMEAIEFWHAERAVPVPEASGAAASDLGVPYPVTELEQHAGSLLTSRSRMDWITATSTLTGAPTLLPRPLVQIGRHVRSDWRIYMLTASTNGLASGNTRAEAIIHGLYEVIERDTTSRLAGRPAPGSLDAAQEHIEPGTVTDPVCASHLALLADAGAWVELIHLPNRFAVPVMVCHLWCEDAPSAIISGSGAHSDPGVALSRAITEAAQSRLTHISGSRDDITPLVYRPGHYQPPAAVQDTTCWAQVTSRYAHGRHTTDTGESAWLARTVTTVTGWEPMAVDLTQGPYQQDDFAVVKVSAPGLIYSARHVIPRSEPLEATP